MTDEFAACVSPVPACMHTSSELLSVSQLELYVLSGMAKL